MSTNRTKKSQGAETESSAKKASAKKKASAAPKDKLAKITDFKPDLAYIVKEEGAIPREIHPTGNLGNDAGRFQLFVQRGVAYIGKTSYAGAKTPSFQKISQEEPEEKGYPMSTGSDGIEKPVPTKKEQEADKVKI